MGRVFNIVHSGFHFTSFTFAFHVGECCYTVTSSSRSKNKHSRLHRVTFPASSEIDPLLDMQARIRHASLEEYHFSLLMLVLIVGLLLSLLLFC